MSSLGKTLSHSRRYLTGNSAHEASTYMQKYANGILLQSVKQGSPPQQNNVTPPQQTKEITTAFGKLPVYSSKPFSFQPKYSSGSWQTAILAGSVALMSTSVAVEAKESPPIELKEKVVLYQYEACPFCNKVKAYLDYRNIPYEVIEVDPLRKKELKFSNYKKVPILIVGEEQLNDSSNIISTLESMLNPSKPSLSETEKEESEEDKWRRWVDNHLVHLLSPNIYRTASEATEAFDYIMKNGNFSFTQRMSVKYVGATAMYFIGKKLKKKHNIKDERAELYQAANEWVNALNGRDFLGGNKPNLADLAVFGVLRPIINLRTGKDLLENSEIGDWYQKMVSEVGETTRLDS